MRKKIVWIFFMGLVSIAYAQAADGMRRGYYQKLQPAITEVPTYPKSTNEAVKLRMNFARHRVLNPEAWQYNPAEVYRVDLVFTRYPHHLETWEVNYDSLLEHRYRALESLIPDLFQSPKAQQITWRIVLQNRCADLKTAKRMFHGFVLYHRPAPEMARNDSLPSAYIRNTLSGNVTNVISTEFLPLDSFSGIRAARFDTVDLRANLVWARKCMENEHSHHDSTTHFVLDRHPEWDSMLVVTDWTASMYRHGAMVLQWHQSQLERGAIRYMTFFNDGDGKYDDEKVIGETGGIYGCALAESESADSLHATLEAVSMGGEGGDHRENDLEALHFALDRCTLYDELVLIADNSGPVRDLAMVKELNVPVRIVLCGVYNQDVHPDYLTIAHHTGGSIHAKEFDLDDLSAAMEHGILTLGEQQYILKGKRFFRYEGR
ncbi:MAG: hypothetical protein AAF570_13450 [Bacteroidota bacterium]